MGGGAHCRNSAIRSPRGGGAGHLGVDGGERIVEHQQLRLGVERARDAEALLLPAAELAAAVAHHRVKACEGEQQYVVILVRNKGQNQLDKGNMW